ncbi:DMT family transporter [Allokutzneria sp. A3M-2-11 16]|uniref:DMT family transporter n=1 Tax=Allokutzneria sp. A3M-2-11 16 TaxID=2962043 RepID=UPI0020B702D2|nr:DMT family transporter [Allokutzneria sp. A3M-2-11 16]MCP3802882.1 DMT family transporter [Allokutzneria sp. A3M-2-11 16]
MHVSTIAPSSRARGLSTLATAGVLWGTGGLLGTLLGRAAELSPLAVATYRLGVGGLLIVAFLLVTRRPLPRGRAVWTRIACVGGLAAIFQSSYFASVSLTSVSIATLITIGCSPVLVLLAERALGRRRIDRTAVLTLGLALTGLALLVGIPSGEFSGAALLAGAGFAVLAAAGFATMTLLGARPVAGLDDLTSTGFAFTLGGLVMVPFADLGFTTSLGGIGLLAALALLPTAAAYTLYFRGLRGIDASTGAVMALLEPLTGAVLAALVLGERLGVVGLVGAALLSSAVIVSARRG